MAKPGPSRPRPLTRQLLSAPAHAHTITRLLAQESAYKDLGRNGQTRAITPKVAYTPTPKRASSRSHKKSPNLYKIRTISLAVPPKLGMTSPLNSG